ncbi:MAG TPA: DUF222 domain-containing protein [Acidimicrobiia bacterium]
MFDHRDVGVGLWPGERLEDLEAEDQLAYRLTCLELADGWTEPDRHVLPSGLEEIAPGPFLAAVVSSVDAERLNGHDAIRLMQARARLGSHHDSGKYVAMAEVACSPPGDADSPPERCLESVEYAAVEIAAGLTLTRRASESQLDLALSLSDRLRQVLTSFSEGRIDLGKVRVFHQMFGHLPKDTVDMVLDRILDDASGLTTGQLRARLTRHVLEADPDGSRASFEEGLNDRKVTAYPNPDHTGSLLISNGHPVEVAAARTHIETLARSLKTGDETRTLDQLRSDVALDLLSGKCACGNPKYQVKPGGSGVDIHVSGSTLAGLSDDPAELAGYGPVFAEIARKTVMENVDGEWRFVVTDNGGPVATGTLARRPSPAQQRQVRANYPKCVHPGCRLDAWDCDLDHRYPHGQGGATCIHNLAPLCRHHHQSKTDGGWKLQRSDYGDHEWTSPSATPTPDHEAHPTRCPMVPSGRT